jgi:ribose 1,5-bisphosphokinase
VFAHRYVAGRANAGRSDEIELPEAEFLARIRHRLFAMHWESGDVRYGIGMKINYWLAVGLSVVHAGQAAVNAGATPAGCRSSTGPVVLPMA